MLRISRRSVFCRFPVAASVNFPGGIHLLKYRQTGSIWKRDSTSGAEVIPNQNPSVSSVSFPTNAESFPDSRTEQPPKKEHLVAVSEPGERNDRIPPLLWVKEPVDHLFLAGANPRDDYFNHWKVLGRQLKLFVSDIQNLNLSYSNGTSTVIRGNLDFPRHILDLIEGSSLALDHRIAEWENVKFSTRNESAASYDSLLNDLMTLVPEIVFKAHKQVVGTLSKRNTGLYLEEIGKQIAERFIYVMFTFHRTFQALPVLQGRNADNNSLESLAIVLFQTINRVLTFSNDGELSLDSRNREYLAQSLISVQTFQLIYQESNIDTVITLLRMLASEISNSKHVDKTKEYYALFNLTYLKALAFTMDCGLAEGKASDKLDSLESEDSADGEILTFLPPKSAERLNNLGRAEPKNTRPAQVNDALQLIKMDLSPFKVSENSAHPTESEHILKGLYIPSYIIKLMNHSIPADERLSCFKLIMEHSPSTLGLSNKPRPLYNTVKLLRDRSANVWEELNSYLDDGSRYNDLSIDVLIELCIWDIDERKLSQYEKHLKILTERIAEKAKKTRNRKFVQKLTRALFKVVLKKETSVKGFGRGLLILDAMIQDDIKLDGETFTLLIEEARRENLSETIGLLLRSHTLLSKRGQNSDARKMLYNGLANSMINFIGSTADVRRVIPFMVRSYKFGDEIFEKTGIWKYLSGYDISAEWGKNVKQLAPSSDSGNVKKDFSAPISVMTRFYRSLLEEFNLVRHDNDAAIKFLGLFRELLDYVRYVQHKQLMDTSYHDHPYSANKLDTGIFEIFLYKMMETRSNEMIQLADLFFNEILKLKFRAFSPRIIEIMLQGYARTKNEEKCLSLIKLLVDDLGYSVGREFVCKSMIDLYISLGDLNAAKFWLNFAIKSGNLHFGPFINYVCDKLDIPIAEVAKRVSEAMKSRGATEPLEDEEKIIRKLRTSVSERRKMKYADKPTYSDPLSDPSSVKELLVDEAPTEEKQESNTELWDFVASSQSQVDRKKLVQLTKKVLDRAGTGPIIRKEPESSDS